MDYFEIDKDERVEFYTVVRVISSIVLTKLYEQREIEQRIEAAKAKRGR